MEIKTNVDFLRLNFSYRIVSRIIRFVKTQVWIKDLVGPLYTLYIFLNIFRANEYFMDSFFSY